MKTESSLTSRAGERSLFPRFLAKLAFAATLVIGIELEAKAQDPLRAPSAPPFQIVETQSVPLLEVVSRRQVDEDGGGAHGGGGGLVKATPGGVRILGAGAEARGPFAASEEGHFTALTATDSPVSSREAAPGEAGDESGVISTPRANGGSSWETEVRPTGAFRSRGPAPDPYATALYEALAKLIVGNRASPLGQGDWGAARAAIGAFYAARGFRPLWIDEQGPTAIGRAIIEQVRRAPDDGLNLTAAPLPARLEPALEPADAAQAEVAVAVAVVAYAEQASGSRVKPLSISPLITARPTIADPGEALADIAAAASPTERLAEFNPAHPGYRALRAELKRLTEISADAARRRVPAFIDVDRGLSVADLIEGETAAAHRAGTQHAGGSPRRAAFRAAVDAEQLALANRRRAIIANMEIWRWEPRDMGGRRVEVNVPDYSVAVVDGETVVLRSRAVVGKPATPTPIFSNAIRYVLLNPSWQVPDSIIKKEIMPRLSHFQQLGYEVKVVDGRVAVRQPPGDGNALGHLAFMFPNEHSVYLHDTPARELFNEEMRALSHGCVRVEEPEKLAELLLGWPEARLEAAFGGTERAVFLPRPLPIHIEYFTEFVDEFGELQERADIYGLTRRVADLIASRRQD